MKFTEKNVGKQLIRIKKMIESNRGIRYLWFIRNILWGKKWNIELVVLLTSDSWKQNRAGSNNSLYSWKRLSVYLVEINAKVVNTERWMIIVRVVSEMITFATDLFDMEIRANELEVPSSSLLAIEGSLHPSSSCSYLQRHLQYFQLIV